MEERLNCLSPMKPNAIRKTRCARMLSVIPAFAIALVLPPASLFGSPPDFAKFPVRSVYHGPPAKPKFRSGSDIWPDSDPRFRSAVEFELAKGANFAGSFTIVQTTCGSGCSYSVVIDTRTGKIFENLPFDMVVVPPGELHGLSYRRESRLLIVEGFVNESKKPTRSFYVWEGTTFRLVQTAPIRSAFKVKSGQDLAP